MHHGEKLDAPPPTNANAEAPSGNLFKDAYNHGVGYAVRHDNLQATALIVGTMTASALAIYLTRGRALGGAFDVSERSLFAEGGFAPVRVMENTGPMRVPPLMDGPHLKLVEGYSHTPFRSLDRPLSSPVLRLATQDGKELLPPNFYDKVSTSMASPRPLPASDLVDIKPPLSGYHDVQSRAFTRMDFLTDVLKNK